MLSSWQMRPLTTMAGQGQGADWCPCWSYKHGKPQLRCGACEHRLVRVASDGPGSACPSNACHSNNSDALVPSEFPTTDCASNRLQKHQLSELVAVCLTPVSLRLPGWDESVSTHVGTQDALQTMSWYGWDFFVATPAVAPGASDDSLDIDDDCVHESCQERGKACPGVFQDHVSSETRRTFWFPTLFYKAVLSRDLCKPQTPPRRGHDKSRALRWTSTRDLTNADQALPSATSIAEKWSLYTK